MKRVVVCVLLLLCSASAEAAMSRVVEVRDSRTIVIQTNDVVSVVTLRDVNVFPPEEARAVAYLRKTLANGWVYVENGDVYRSPDALFINKAMKQRAWIGVTYLGELYLADAAPARKLPTVQKRPTAQKRTTQKRK